MFLVLELARQESLKYVKELSIERGATFASCIGNQYIDSLWTNIYVLHNANFITTIQKRVSCNIY